MLLNILNEYGLSRQGLAMILLTIPCVLLTLIVHEVSHGFAALKCGDPTARNMGRLTLNPLPHLDPIGTLMMFLVGFGWANPVPVVPRNFRKPKRDMAIVAFAGPLANLLLALVVTLIEYALLRFLPMGSVLSVTSVSGVLLLILEMLKSFNIGIALFNLIPLPPLDGSNILLSFLPPKLAAKYMRIRFYVPYILLGLMALNFLASRSALFSGLSGIIWYPVDKLRELLAGLMDHLGYWLFFSVFG